MQAIKESRANEDKEYQNVLVLGDSGKLAMVEIPEIYTMRW